MKRTVERSDLLQRAQRMQRKFSYFFLSALCEFSGEKVYFKNITFGFILILALGGLLNTPHSAHTTTPTQTTTVELVVHLLGVNNQPLAGVAVNLVLNRYGQTIEEIPLGSCVTDTTGSCSIMVSDPPRLRSGKIEGFIDLGVYGRQLIGWEGERFEITLQLSPDGKLATAPAPLDQPYKGQTEQPTDAPLSKSSHTPLATGTPTTTVTISTFKDTPTNGPITATMNIVATAIITIQPNDTQTPIPPKSTSPKAQRLEWDWIVIGLLLLAVFGTAFILRYHRQYKNKHFD